MVLLSDGLLFCLKMFDISDFYSSLSYYSSWQLLGTQVSLKGKGKEERWSPWIYHTGVFISGQSHSLHLSPFGGPGWAHLRSLFSRHGQRLAGLLGWGGLTLSLGDGVDLAEFIPMTPASILIREGPLGESRVLDSTIFFWDKWSYLNHWGAQVDHLSLSLPPSIQLQWVTILVLTRLQGGLLQEGLATISVAAFHASLKLPYTLATGFSPFPWSQSNGTWRMCAICAFFSCLSFSLPIITTCQKWRFLFSYVKYSFFLTLASWITMKDAWESLLCTVDQTPWFSLPGLVG